MSLRIKSQAAIYNSNLSLGIYPVAYRFSQSLFTTLYNVHGPSEINARALEQALWEHYHC